MASKTFYVTTPIYYVNAEPHLGHAYTTIVADVLARFHRLDGYDAFFLTGTDEHGDKVLEAARGTGETPREFVDRVSGMFRSLWPRINAEPSRFIRTTEPEHVAVVQRILSIIHDKGDIYFGEYGGYYCQGCERFVLERELVDGLCPDHRTKPTWIAEKNYFFRMSNYQDWLIDHINRQPDFIRPQRYANEVLSFLKEPLEDLCISRPKSRLPWGIELPFDDRYVTYVWFDALINYLTGVNWPDGDAFGKYWPVAWHLVAKDILKPHGIYWPTMLQAAGIPVYQHLNVHGYWNFGGGKMSKSLGNVVKPLELMDRYGPEAFRYFLMREMSFGLDASFSEEALVARLNGDLANDLGNLFSRVTAMLLRYSKGLVEAGSPPGPAERTLEDLARETVDIYRREMGGLQFHMGLRAVWDYVNALNKYVDEAQPWALAKDPASQPDLRRVLLALTEGLVRVAYLIWPVMPQTAEQMLDRLGLKLHLAPEGLAGLKGFSSQALGRRVTKGPALFPRIETEPEKPDRAAAQEPPAEDLDIEEFARLRLRVGRVLDCEQPKGSKKLLALKIDLGEPEPRQVLAGLAGHYRPEEVIGRLVVVVANLKPKKMMGLQSHGMVLAAVGGDRVRLLEAPQGAEPGDLVR